MNPPISTAPVFVLCFARSGSTLLRCILDSHPDYCCPPELHLAFLARHLHRAYSITLKEGGTRSESRVHALACEKTSRDIHGMMSAYAQDMGKSVWCEKSVSTIDMTGVTRSVFPDARYICLHRNCLDMAASALEIQHNTRSGASFGFESYLGKRPENPTEGLIEYWIAKTGAMLSFEESNPGKCIRVKYESVTQDTAGALDNMFAFLGSSWQEEMLDNVFSSHREPFAGDHKFRDTNRIHSESVDSGRNIDTGNIPAGLRVEMNRLLQRLDYDSVPA